MSAATDVLELQVEHILNVTSDFEYTTKLSTFLIYSQNKGWGGEPLQLYKQNDD